MTSNTERILHAARPQSVPYPELQSVLGADCFADTPNVRVRAASRVAPEAEQSARSLSAWLAPSLASSLPWMPHASGAMNAWGLLMLTGPGRDEDPNELEYNWAPGLSKPAPHLMSFPAYAGYTGADATERGHSWFAIRDVLRRTDLPGVDAESRLSCWGVANLSVLHFAADKDRIPDDPVVTLERMRWVIGTCRPRLILVTPALEREGTVERAMREVLGSDAPPFADACWRWASDRKTYEMRARAWEGHGGVIVISTVNNHPARWRSQPPVRLGAAVQWTLAVARPSSARDAGLIRRLSGYDEPAPQMGLVRRKL